MADFPAMPLWTDAYLADTRHLSTIEHGAYLLLLMEAWRRPTRSLPDDDRLLARLAGVSVEEWEHLKPIVMAFWRRDGRSQTWSQKRLQLEASYVAKKSRSQASNAAKRWNKTEKQDATALPNACQNDAPTPTPTPSSDNAKASSHRAKRLEPSWQPARPYPVNVAALVAEWPPGREAREIDGFVDYWTTRSKDAAKLDWEKTWHNRIRDQHDRIMREARNGANRGNGAASSRSGDGFLNAIRESRATREANESGGIPGFDGMG